MGWCAALAVGCAAALVACQGGRSATGEVDASVTAPPVRVDEVVDALAQAHPGSLTASQVSLLVTAAYVRSSAVLLDHATGALKGALLGHPQDPLTALGSLGKAHNTPAQQGLGVAALLDTHWAIQDAALHAALVGVAHSIDIQFQGTTAVPWDTLSLMLDLSVALGDAGLRLKALSVLEDGLAHPTTEDTGAPSLEELALKVILLVSAWEHTGNAGYLERAQALTQRAWLKRCAPTGVCLDSAAPWVAALWRLFEATGNGSYAQLARHQWAWAWGHATAGQVAALSLQAMIMDFEMHFLWVVRPQGKGVSSLADAVLRQRLPKIFLRHTVVDPGERAPTRAMAALCTPACGPWMLSQAQVAAALHAWTARGRQRAGTGATAPSVFGPGK